MPDHVLDLSRAQFAMTAVFHILWPILTISTRVSGASCWR
jgi:cytochrome d ubiquinol oxidase subunit I